MFLNEDGRSLCKPNKNQNTLNLEDPPPITPAALTLPVFMYLAVYTRGLAKFDESTLTFVRLKSRIHARGAKTWAVCKQDHELVDSPLIPTAYPPMSSCLFAHHGTALSTNKVNALDPISEKQPDPETYAHHLMPG